MSTIQIADKPTLDAVLEAILRVNTNSSKTLDTLIAEKQDAADALITSKHATTDALITSKHATTDQLINTVDANVDALLARLTTTRVGYLDYLANSTYGLNALLTAINAVKSVASTSVVKSVQRGKVSGKTPIHGIVEFKLRDDGYIYAGYHDITISPVDITKTVAFVSGYDLQYSGSYIFELINSTTLRVYVSSPSTADSFNTSSNSYSWQVIEFR